MVPQEQRGREVIGEVNGEGNAIREGRAQAMKLAHSNCAGWCFKRPSPVL